MSFNISFDYRFDASGFFDNPAARAALEAAAAVWEGIIGDEFADVPAGVSFYVSNPITGASELIVLEQAIDDLLIFVGASPTPFGIAIEGAGSLLPEGYGCGCPCCTPGAGTESAGVLARAGYAGWGASGDALNGRISGNFRGAGPVTDFEPWVGNMSFNPGWTWNFDTTGAVPGKFDFLTVALHEIGHVLGVGTAPAFAAWLSGTSFVGPNAVAANGGAPLPMQAGGGHVQAGHAGDTVLMDPSIGSNQRILPSAIDRGLLADIGYEIAGTTPQGARTAITTEGSDAPVFGTVVADLIDGLGGNDQIQGNAGDDTLRGGAGDDTLFGQSGDDRLEGGGGADYLAGGAGADTLAGGPGADTLYGEGGIDSFRVEPGGGIDTIGDFDLATETLVIAAGFGFASVAAVLTTISKPFSNVTRLQLDPTTAIDIFHPSQSGSPIAAGHIVLETVPPPNGAPTANPDTAATVAGVAVTIDALANDTDPDGDPLAILSHGDPGTGTLAVVAGRFVFTPAPDFAGVAQWDYVAGDGHGGQSGSVVTVTVAPAALDWAGTDAANVRYGGAGNDTLRGLGGTDTLGGGGGDDSLLGGGDDDRLFGEAGADTLAGGPGFDLLFGHDGDDLLIGDAGDDAIGQGDTLTGGAGNDTLHGNGGADRLFGGAGDDSLTGGAGFDVLMGEAGDDSLAGGSERDTLDGGDGDDRLDGGDGHDLLIGGDGADTIRGGSGNDFVDAGGGNDLVEGGDGADTILGREGADTILGGAGVDLVLAGAGDDSVEGGAGNDRLHGEDGDDRLDGGDGDDQLFGNAGADTLDGGGGDDRLGGGSGADSLAGGTGSDTLAGEAGADTLDGGDGDDRLDGGDGDDRISGGDGDDILFGRDGADSLAGGAGIDVLRGGTGDDTIEAGPGDDRMGGDAGADAFVFGLGDGNDLVFDFEPGIDRILFRDGPAGFVALGIGTDASGRATISYGPDPGDIIRLIGVDAGDLADDGTFVFAPL